MTSQAASLQGAFDARKTRRLAAAIPAAALISILTLSLMYSGYPIFGPINDLTNAVMGLLIALFVWRFHALLRGRAPGAAALVLLAAWAGCAAIIVNSILVAFGRMYWMDGAMYTSAGYGLIGIWLLVLHRLVGSQPFLTPGMVRLGSTAGAAMLFGFSAGPLLAGGVNPAGSPLTLISYVGSAAGYLLFPLWCWLLSRRLAP